MTPEELTAALRPGDRERLRRRKAEAGAVTDGDLRRRAAQYEVEIEVAGPTTYRLTAAGVSVTLCSDLREAEIWPARLRDGDATRTAY